MSWRIWAPKPQISPLKRERKTLPWPWLHLRAGLSHPRGDGQVSEDEARRKKLEKILQDAELRMAKALEPLRIGTKVGPILGLMGTLIPMGPVPDRAVGGRRQVHG